MIKKIKTGTMRLGKLGEGTSAKKMGRERQQTDRQAQGRTPVIPHHEVEVGDPDYTLRPCLN